MSKVDKVELKCGNGCCPEAIFDKKENGVLLQEDNQYVFLSANSLEKLIDESRKRGLIK